MQIYFVLQFPFVHNHVNANRNKTNTLSFCQAVTLRHRDGKRIKCVGYENTLCAYFGGGDDMPLDMEYCVRANTKNISEFVNYYYCYCSSVATKHCEAV